MAFKLKGSRLALSNTAWNVFLDHVVDEHNEIPDYIVVRPLRERTGNVAGVAVLPVLNDHLVLIRSYRHPLDSEIWEVARGFIDADETATQAALRELKEETGLTCSPDDLIPLGHYAPEPSTIAGRGALFVATKCAGQPRHGDDELGIRAVHRFTRDEIRSLLDKHEIEDAGTAILLHRYFALGR